MEISAVLNETDGQLRERGNRRLIVKLAVVVVFFSGFGFAMVPLYDAFCRITGLNGRTNAAAMPVVANTQVDMARSIRVEFLSHSMPGVGLSLKPETFSIHVNPGAIIHTTYEVRNITDRVYVGQAVPSITPATATQYFQKIECFCFEKQTLQPGEVRTMPVVFVVRPELPDALRTITLSYTFFQAV